MNETLINISNNASLLSTLGEGPKDVWVTVVIVLLLAIFVFYMIYQILFSE